MNAELGRRLRQARKEMGLSGAELARRIGKSQPYISDLERGQRTPSLPTLRALARALNRPLSYFLAVDDDEPEAADLSGRMLPTDRVKGFHQLLAANIADQLLATRVVKTDDDMDRDKLIQLVHQALQNAYHQARLTSVSRSEAVSNR